MTVRPSKIDTYIDHEGPVAERYKWWGVYLIREKRRLQGIAEAVAGGIPLAGQADVADRYSVPTTRADFATPPGIETPDELLTRVDAELGIADALPQLEEEAVTPEESKTHGNSVRDEQTIPDDLQKRKLSGRASLLGRKKASSGGEDF